MKGLNEGDDENPTCQPEKSKLWMPSTIGKEECLSCGWGVMTKQEVKLRVGQADEALEKLRVALGQKTLIY
jgi:Zn ribbon nucleic-acid-binding protein